MSNPNATALESALFAYLTSRGPITAIVNDRIYPGEVERPGVPFIVYEIEGAADRFTRSGYTGLLERRVVVTCVGKTYDQAVELADAVKDAIPLWRFEVNSVSFRMFRRDDERDYHASSKGTTKPVGRQLDYTVKYAVTTDSTPSELTP